MSRNSTFPPPASQTSKDKATKKKYAVKPAEKMSRLMELIIQSRKSEEGDVSKILKEWRSISGQPGAKRG